MKDSNRPTEKELFWRSLFSDHDDSGMTVKAFCHQRGVSVPSFYAWRSKLSKSRTDEQRLVPVNIVDSSDHTPVGDSPGHAKLIEIVTPGGFTVRIDQTVEPSKLAGLLHAIASYQGKVESC